MLFFLNYMIDETELQSILEITNKKNPSFWYWKYDRIEGTQDDMSDSETKAEFWLTTSEFPHLAGALRPRPHEDDCKRKRFYGFSPSVHTKAMKTLTVNA